MTFAFILESVGGTEWLVLLGVILIVVGPKNLPAAARKMGSIMSTLRRAADEFKRQLLSMDEEFRKAVDEGENESTSEDAAPENNDTLAAQTPPEDDPSTVPDSEDRAEEEGSAYDYDSPYPGHDYYDETQYQPAASDAGPEMGDGDATAAEPAPEPAKPKSDPYAIKITVSTSADKGKKK